MTEQIALLEVSNLLRVSDRVRASLRRRSGLLVEQRTLVPPKRLYADESEARNPVLYSPNVIDQALTALAALEIAARTPFFRSRERLPPIDSNSLSDFVLVNYEALSCGPYSLAAEFLARYSTSDPENSSFESQANRTTQTHEELSFGQCSGFLDLVDELLSNVRLQRFFGGLKWYNPASGLVRRTVASAQALFLSYGSIREFIDFTLDLQAFLYALQPSEPQSQVLSPESANEITKPLTDRDSFRIAVRQCFAPWYLGSRVTLVGRLTFLRFLFRTSELAADLQLAIVLLTPIPKNI